MKEPYMEGVATHCGSGPCAFGGNAGGEALAQGKGRPGIELRNHNFEAPTLLRGGEGHAFGRLYRESLDGLAESLDPVHAWTLHARKSGDPGVVRGLRSRGPVSEGENPND